MKDHEIFQSGVYNELDNIVLTDKVYDDVDYRFCANYIDSLDSIKFKDLELTISSSQCSDCFFFDKSEVDALIGFLTFVRSKMG